MRKVRIAELKNNLSRYLDHVKAGGTVLVLDRDRPVAHIVPLTTPGPVDAGDERLTRLERSGLIRRGQGGVTEWLRTHRAVKIPGGLLKTLLEERRSGW